MTLYAKTPNLQRYPLNLSLFIENIELCDCKVRHFTDSPLLFCNPRSYVFLTSVFKKWLAKWFLRESLQPLDHCEISERLKKWQKNQILHQVVGRHQTRILFSRCLFVSWNIKTAEPIWPFFVVAYVTPKKVYRTWEI